ncbi:unnamed protein product [Urochloa humidicola]
MCLLRSIIGFGKRNKESLLWLARFLPSLSSSPHHATPQLHLAPTACHCLHASPRLKPTGNTCSRKAY